MTIQRRSEQEAAALDLTLEGGRLPVSALSTLLRALQACLREVARTDGLVGEQFAEPSGPVLMVTLQNSHGDLVLRLEFVDRDSSESIPEVSSRVFEAFLEQLGDFVKTLPQPGLWGVSTRGAKRGRYRSAAEKRMD